MLCCYVVFVVYCCAVAVMCLIMCVVFLSVFCRVLCVGFVVFAAVAVFGVLRVGVIVCVLCGWFCCCVCVAGGVVLFLLCLMCFVVGGGMFCVGLLFVLVWAWLGLCVVLRLCNCCFWY